MTRQAAEGSPCAGNRLGRRTAARAMDDDSDSSRDRREMKRIARLQSDAAIFHRADTSPRYAALWRRWLATKGPDTAIVFATAGRAA